jgi:hypothetical protein
MVTQEKLETDRYTVGQLIYYNPEDQIIRTDWPCSRCITKRYPEHFLYATWYENAIAIAGPIIRRAMEIDGFLEMELRSRKFPSKFRLDGQDLVWLNNTRELVQMATHWMIKHHAKNEHDVEVFRRVYNSYLAIVEYNMVADIEGTLPSDTTPEWFLLLQGLSDVDTPEV